jgi:hypothetical protein
MRPIRDSATKEVDMNAATEAIPGTGQKVHRVPRTPLPIRIRTRLHRGRLDRELVSGADPNLGPLRRERAQQLVGEEWRRRSATNLERLLAEADSPPRPFNPRVPIARAAIRDSRGSLDTVVERLRAPAYISPQGVAMITALLSDGAGPLYGSGTSDSEVLGRALEDTLHAIDNGPELGSAEIAAVAVRAPVANRFPPV